MTRGPWDAVVIGGGPAGLAAGMYLSRAGHSVILLEREALGGQARLLDRVENYPGFPSGVPGGTLMDRWVRQALRWGLKLRMEAARAITRRNGRLRVGLRRRASLETRAVIRCTGGRFKKLAVPGEKRLFGRGVWHAAFAEARRFAGKTVAVVGSGEAALHQAAHLARFAARVLLITRTRRFHAHPLLKRRLARRGNVAHIPCSVVESLEGPGRLKGARIRNLADGARRTVGIDGLFVLIGKKPDPLASRLRSIPGVFIAGDARGTRFRQVAVAGGDGIRAAMECAEYLEAVKAPITAPGAASKVRRDAVKTGTRANHRGT